MKAAPPEEVALARARVAAGEAPKEVAYDLKRTPKWVRDHTRDLRRRSPDPRSHIISVRLSGEEFDRLDRAARANGHSYSAELRSRL